MTKAFLEILDEEDDGGIDGYLCYLYIYISIYVLAFHGRFL